MSATRWKRTTCAGTSRPASNDAPGDDLDNRISFVLTPSLTIKRVTPLDVIKEAADPTAQNDDERFDSDVTLMTGELARMLASLIDILGGEQRLGASGGSGLNAVGGRETSPSTTARFRGATVQRELSSRARRVATRRSRTILRVARRREIPPTTAGSQPAKPDGANAPTSRDSRIRLQETLFPSAHERRDSLDQAQHLAKTRMAAGTQPFEPDHLDRRDLHPAAPSRAIPASRSIVLRDPTASLTTVTLRPLRNSPSAVCNTHVRLATGDDDAVAPSGKARLYSPRTRRNGPDDGVRAQLLISGTFRPNWTGLLLGTHHRHPEYLRNTGKSDCLRDDG